MHGDPTLSAPYFPCLIRNSLAGDSAVQCSILAPRSKTLVRVNAVPLLPTRNKRLRHIVSDGIGQVVGIVAWFKDLGEYVTFV